MALKLNDSEWTVMNALWEGSPASAREVLSRIEESTGWAYSTVKTVLARLAEKGVLRVRTRGNTNLYEPRFEQEEARRSAVRALLDKAFDGTFGSLLQHIVAEERLSKKDKERLKEMLAEIERGGRRRKGS